MIELKCMRATLGAAGEKYKDESGEQWEGASKSFLGKLFLYFVFHRHFSKSDQGHGQQQHPCSLLTVAFICSF